MHFWNRPFNFPSSCASFFFFITSSITPALTYSPSTIPPVCFQLCSPSSSSLFPLYSVISSTHSTLTPLSFPPYPIFLQAPTSLTSFPPSIPSMSHSHSFSPSLFLAHLNIVNIVFIPLWYWLFFQHSCYFCPPPLSPPLMSWDAARLIRLPVSPPQLSLTLVEMTWHIQSQVITQMRPLSLSISLFPLSLAHT